MNTKDKQIFEIDVIEFAATAWRCKFSITLIFLLCILLGFSYGFTRQSKFTAGMQVESLGIDSIQEFETWNALTAQYRSDIFNPEEKTPDSVIGYTKGISNYIFPAISSETLFREFLATLNQKQALIRLILRNSEKFPRLNALSANQKDAAFDLINSISVAYDSSESFSNEFSATIYITGSDKRELRALMLTLLDLVSMKQSKNI